MVDQLTDIPLPGRSFASPLAGATDSLSRLELPTFVAGPENRLVAAAVHRLLESTSAASANLRGVIPLTPVVLALFGSSGTGKTHLADGLVRYWQQQHGQDAALYLTANDFRRQYAAAIRGDCVLEFRRCVRGRRLLAIDDLHQLPADDHVLQELRYTFDAYDDEGGTLVVTSHRPVTALANLSPDVRSRLSAGILLQLAPPGTAARLRIIRQMSAALGSSLSDDDAGRLAHGINGTARDLLGAILQLCSTPQAECAADAGGAEQLLSARRPSLREIIAVVARYTSVPQKQLKSSSRKQSIVFARSVVVHLARELAGASYHEIGRALGGRDHSTIMHNYRKIDGDRQTCSATQETLDDLRRILISR